MAALLDPVAWAAVVQQAVAIIIALMLYSAADYVIASAKRRSSASGSTLDTTADMGVVRRSTFDTATGTSGSTLDTTADMGVVRSTFDTATGTWRDVERLQSTRQDQAINTDSPEQYRCCPLPTIMYVSKYGEVVHTRMNCEGLRRATSDISQRRWCKYCEPRAA